MAGTSLVKLIRHFALLFLLYFMWICIGGVLFIYLEVNCEDDTEMFIEQNNSNSKRSSNLLVKFEDIIELHVKDREIQSELLQNITRLLYDVFDNVANKTRETCEKWTFRNFVRWMNFSSSTLFTIGFGDPAPKTSTGRITVMFYALVGMPVTLAMLGVAGQIIINSVRCVIEIFESRVYQRQVRHKNVKILFFVLFLIIISTLGGCMIGVHTFLQHEPWLVSLYYWFQTITTIGYGDLKLKQNQFSGWRSLILVPYVFLIIIGLALMSALLNIVATILTTTKIKLALDDVNDVDEQNPVSL